MTTSVSHPEKDSVQRIAEIKERLEHVSTTEVWYEVACIEMCRDWNLAGGESKEADGLLVAHAANDIAWLLEQIEGIPAAIRKAVEDEREEGASILEHISMRTEFEEVASSFRQAALTLRDPDYRTDQEKSV